MKTFRCQLKVREGVQSFYKTVLRLNEGKVSMPGKAFPAWIPDYVLGTSTHPTGYSLPSGVESQNLGPRAPFRVPGAWGVSFLGIR